MSEKPWYHEGLRFECLGCGRCCTGDPGYVYVIRAEIEALAKVVGMPVDEFEKTHVRQVGRRRSLVELPNGDCVFYDRQNRRCAVYAARPRQCRTWPFWPSNLRTPEQWGQTCRACPGCGRGRLFLPEEIAEQAAIIRV
jgi:hypothetical protein